MNLWAKFMIYIHNGFSDEGSWFDISSPEGRERKGILDGVVRRSAEDWGKVILERIITHSPRL